MCGICGFMDHKDGPISDTLDMLSKIKHRGPDQAGVFIGGDIWHAEDIEELKTVRNKGRVSLGQTRLQIVGGEEGVQPICGEKLTIVHNGEIYNHRELRSLLRHHKINSMSDSEIIVHLIEDFYKGSLVDSVKETMPLLDGMYAFAVTDGKTLVLARDPIGKKPIYFTDGIPFYFASERKALKNKNGDVKRLPPGKVLEVSASGIRMDTGYEIEKPPIEIDNAEDALSAYEQAFDRAIEKRVAGLKRVGVLFSGGIDSVLVARAIQLTDCKVTCYSVGAEDRSDIEMALRAARELGLNIEVEYLTEALIEELIPEIIEAIELNGLIQVEAAIPMYIAAKMCRDDGHKVMFSGQGADELFAGYSWYNEVVREKGHLVLHDKLWDDINKLYIDTLEREDRMAMAHSIELRAPFLDRELIRTAMRIAPHLKIRDAYDPYRKLVHRELALKKGISREIAYREKSRAQDGTGVHDMIRLLAEKRFNGRKFKETQVLDYGSNYRYLEDEYATPAAIAYLEEIAQINCIDFLATNNEETLSSEKL